MSQSKQQLPQEFIYNHCAEDEINLVDLWLVIKKRRVLIFYSVIFFTLLSLLVSLGKVDKYQYKTTIEIGVRVVGGEFIKIESPSTVLAKLNESYIPLVLSEYVKNNDPDYKNKLEIKARIPKNSEIIVLESSGRESQEELYIQLLNQAVKKINQDHGGMIRLIKKSLDVEINGLSSKVLAYNDEINFVKAKFKMQEKVSALIKQEINNTDRVLNNVVKNKQKAVNEVKDESKALTLMLLNSEIRKAQEKSAELKERLFVKVVETKDRLNKKIRDIKRKIKGVRDQQSQLMLEKESIKETRALAVPIRSLDKVGIGRRFIVIIGFMLGLFFGVILVFVSEFSKKICDAEEIQNANSCS